MNTVKYGKWEIAVDIDKTREYYKSYVLNESQANRNFAEYCKVMSVEERAFFDSLGITPECCEIEHVCVNKKNEFPCGGYYLICGRYLSYPKEELLTVDDLIEIDFEDDREDPRVDIGLFQFDFQCEDYEFKEIPEDMPEGFICVRFWCENMRWHLDEKPEPDMIMYEPARFWQFWRIIKQGIADKKQRRAYSDGRRSEFISIFERLGIEYTELGAKQIRKFKRDWINALSPDGANRREIEKLCLSNRKYTTFLWHIFSYEFVSSKTNPKEHYNGANKVRCIIISNVDPIGFAVTNAEKLTADVLDDFIDVTVSAHDFSWTYCKTHECVCGPYYYEK